MKKTNYKKGFTLAELLIVVAIIAVLAAIAVPLFVGALSNAETRVKEANRRAVKGIAIAEILGKEEYRNIKVGTENKQANKWTITAKVDMTGNVTELTINAESADDPVEYDDGSCEKTKDTDGKEYYNITGMVLNTFTVTKGA